MSIAVTWSVRYRDLEGIEPFLKDIETLWAGLAVNGQAAAAFICEDIFNGEMWAAHFGTEDTHDTVYLDIHSPEPISGRYRVELERRTKATAQKLLPVLVGSA